MSLKSDLYRYSGSIANSNNLKLILRSAGPRFVFYFRMCQKFRKFHPVGLFFRLLFHFLTSRKNIEIPFTTFIGRGIYFGHLKNITINANSKIGRNCNIMQGVTIGNESRGKRKGAPVIGNRVLIGPNSVLTGKINIGDDVLIGPLTFVNFDIPDKAVVLGNPAKIVSYNGSEGYINKVLK